MSGDSPFVDLCEPGLFQCELAASCGFCDSSLDHERFNSLSERTRSVLSSSEHCSHCFAIQSCSELDSAEVSRCQMQKLCEQCHFFLEQLTVKETLDWTRLPDYCFAITDCDITPDGPAPSGPSPTGSAPQPSTCETGDAKCELDHICSRCPSLTEDPSQCDQLCSKLRSCTDGNCQVGLPLEFLCHSPCTANVCLLSPSVALTHITLDPTHPHSSKPLALSVTSSLDQGHLKSAAETLSLAGRHFSLPCHRERPVLTLITSESIEQLRSRYEQESVLIRVLEWYPAPLLCTHIPPIVQVSDEAEMQSLPH